MSRSTDHSRDSTQQGEKDVRFLLINLFARVVGYFENTLPILGIIITFIFIDQLYLHVLINFKSIFVRVIKIFYLY